MFKKLVIDLSASYESDIIYHNANNKQKADEGLVNIVWSGATVNCGSIEVRTVFDNVETDSWDILDTISLSTASGRETVYSDIDCVGIKIKYTKSLTTSGTATIYIRTSD